MPTPRKERRFRAYFWPIDVSGKAGPSHYLEALRGCGEANSAAGTGHRTDCSFKVFMADRVNPVRVLSGDGAVMNVLSNDESAGRQGIEAVLRLATDELCVDVRAPSRSAVFRYGQHVSAVERVFTRHNPLVSKSSRFSRTVRMTSRRTVGRSSGSSPASTVDLEPSPAACRSTRTSSGTSSARSSR